MSDNMPKVGDKIRCIAEDCFFLTYGKEYEVIGTSDEYFRFIDDEGDILGDNDFREWELVNEAVGGL